MLNSTKVFRQIALMAMLLSFAMSCVPFRDSPFSDTLLRSERNLNASNIAAINKIEDDGVIRIAVFSDTHGNYKDADRVIRDINAAEGIDFAVHLGDLTNSSYNYEYDQFIASYVKLRVPSLMVMGNHDAIGAGPSLFAKAFGASNYIFESEHVRFIFWNSVGLEDPDDFSSAWLLTQVQESTKPVLIFTHIPLDDPERFFDEDRANLDQVLGDAKVQAVLNGHNHVYSLTSVDGTPLLQSPRAQDGEWLLFEIRTDGFKVQRSQNEGVTWVSFKNAGSLSF